MGVRAMIVCGKKSAIRSRLMSYCFERFESERIWLVDSAQVFDPYALSGVDVARARRMLHSIRVSRPFTIYQLRDKVLGLADLALTSSSTVIISSLDCFADDVADDEERDAIMGKMLASIDAARKRTGCRIIIGVKDRDAANSITSRLPASVFSCVDAAAGA